MSEILAIIPARGGSKGIPRKNLLELAGHPLLAYSIAHALASRQVTRVIVSTEDEEIAGVAREYGAEVPFVRPREYATDTATDLEVFRHALSTLAEQEDYFPDLVVQLRPTDPVRQVATVDRAIERMLETPEADCLRSIKLATYTPYKMWRVADGRLFPLLEIEGVREAHSMPRQLLPPVYQGSGYVDVLRPRTILELGSMCGNYVLPFVIDELCFDLDHPDQIPAIEAELMRQVEKPTRHVEREPKTEQTWIRSAF